jgi:hypothetical protein
MRETINHRYFKAGLICILANVAVGGGIDNPSWWVFVVTANLLVNCKGSK